MVRTLPLLLALGCAEVPCDDMTAGPAGLVVVPAEHPTGWGLDRCAACHVTAVTHTRACTPGIDLEAVRLRVDEEGEASCAACHGDNGRTAP